MGVYLQMGHQSDNLLSSPELSRFQGAILSPVNYDQAGITRIITNNSSLETIFDPQLYFPRTEVERLRVWPYFPSGGDTVDFNNYGWWSRENELLIQTLSEIHPDAVCSPVFVPRSFTNEYYSLTVQVGNQLCDLASSLGIEVLQTVLVNLPDLANRAYVLNIASIVSRTNANRIYLIFQSLEEQRRELSNDREIMGALLLINLLSKSGIKVLVGFCSSDIILWKAAGAVDFATGKFFNLRRFTPSRWDVDEGGGGQIAYWFEEGLLAYLREPDIIRVERVGLLSDLSRNNPFYGTVRDCMSSGTPWVRYGWRQYLYWFADVENRMTTGSTDCDTLLRMADRNWLLMDKSRVLLDERVNNGEWIRQWRQAIEEYDTEW